MTMKTMEKVSVEVRRGDVFMVDLGEGVGSEQKNYRPCLVISNAICNKVSPTITICVISSNVNKRPMPTHVFIRAGEGENGLDKDSVVFAEQIRTIDKQRLVKKVATLSEDKMSEVDHAIQVQLGFAAPQPRQQERPVTNSVVTVPSERMTTRPAAPIFTDTGRNQAWKDKSKRSNFVAPSIVPLKKEVK